MTTFQLMIDAIFNALSQVIPLSESVYEELYRSVLKWPATLPETLLLTTLVASLCFLVFFRYDWLGLFSALLKSIVSPKTLGSSVRTLDQQIVIFLSLITIPGIVAKHVLFPFVKENESLNHPFVMAGIFLALAGAYQFAANWNKRLMGLNHIKLKDAVVVGALTLLSAHPAVPFVFTVWFGLALTNYHYDAIFKYSMLALGLQIWIHFFGLLHEVSLKDAFATVGHLNSIAMLVILVTTIWMSLENLQKNLNENTLKAFKWFNVGCALFYGVVYFIRG